MDEWMLSEISSLLKLRGCYWETIPLQSIVTTAFDHVTYCYFIHSPCFSTLQAKLAGFMHSSAYVCHYCAYKLKHNIIHRSWFYVSGAPQKNSGPS